MSDTNAQVTAIAPINSTEEANQKLALASLQTTRDSENIGIMVSKIEDTLKEEIEKIRSELIPLLDKKIAAACEDKDKELKKREKVVEAEIRKEKDIVAFLALGAKINVWLGLELQNFCVNDEGTKIQVGTRYTQPGYGNGVSPMSKSCFLGKKDEDADEKSKARLRFYPLGKALEAAVQLQNKLLKMKTDLQGVLLKKQIAFQNIGTTERRLKARLLVAHRSSEELSALECLIQGERGNSDAAFSKMVSTIKNLG